MKNSKKVFIILGVIALIEAVIVNGAYIFVGKFPEGILLFAMTILCFCMAYLTDHFAEKDERAQKIRERGMFVSYFWMIGIAVILLILLNPYFNLVNLSGYHTISLIITLYISVVFLNMTYYAWKY